MDIFNYSRRETSEVHIGATPMGGSNPIRIQSMTNTATQDTEASVAQTKRIVDAGGEYVRLTAQGIKEAENLMNINAALRQDGYMTPLVADVHFNPKVADVAAQYAEKVRINPGNYVDSARTFKHLEYTDEEYAQELRKIRDRFVPFLNICKANHTAIRIRPYHVALRRHSRRHGRIVHGVSENLRCGAIHGRSHFHQSIQYGNHGENRTFACPHHGERRDALSLAPRCDGSR